MERGMLYVMVNGEVSAVAQTQLPSIGFMLWGINTHWGQWGSYLAGILWVCWEILSNLHILYPVGKCWVISKLTHHFDYNVFWKNLSIYPQGSPLKGWNLMFMFRISAIQLPIQYLYLFVYHANSEVLGLLWLGASVLAKVLMCNEGVCGFHIGFTWDRKGVKLHSLSYLVQSRGPYIVGRYR